MEAGVSASVVQFSFCSDWSQLALGPVNQTQADTLTLALSLEGRGNIMMQGRGDSPATRDYAA